MNNTLVNGMALLEALAHSGQALGISELAARTGIGKSNVHRLLQTLGELGYVQRDVLAGSYRASIRIWELGTAVLSHMDLRPLALPAMEALLAETRETVHFSVLDGDDVVYLHKLDSPQPVRAYSTVGGRAPAHCVATGKAMLAFRSDAQLNALAQTLRAHTAKTVVDPLAFFQEMTGIRNRGYAVNTGEWQETVNGVAAPVRDPSGRVIAAVGVSGPAERLRAAHFKGLGDTVIAAATRIEDGIRHGPAATAPVDPCGIGQTAAREMPAAPSPRSRDAILGHDD